MFECIIAFLIIMAAAVSSLKEKENLVESETNMNKISVRDFPNKVHRMSTRLNYRWKIGIRIALIILGLMFLLSAMFMARLTVSVRAEPRTIYVDVGNAGDPDEDGTLQHPFDEIQEGVDAASSGDIIYVASGIYYQYVEISKSSISLVGEGEDITIIDGGGTRNGIRVGGLPGIYAEYVGISGFTVRNCIQGIKFVRCRYACLRNNKFVGNEYNFLDFSLQINDIDTSNTVDGKPIYYWVNQHDKQVPMDAGYVAVIDSTNIVVRDLNLTKNGQGVLFKNTTGSLMKNVNISNNWDGIVLDSLSHDNTIIGSTVSNNKICGFYLSATWMNTIKTNEISRNQYGVFLDSSTNSSIIVDNMLSENWCGLDVYGSSHGNVIYHNNFVNNAYHARCAEYTNTWDYAGEGNYWSDYAGQDLNDDGIGDTPYNIDENNQDNHPLMGSFTDFSVAWQYVTYHVTTISNSDVTEFYFIQPEKLITFGIAGPDAAVGFCRVTIPNILLGGPYTVLVDDSPPATLIETSNETHSFLYMTYDHNAIKVKVEGTTVIPEFSSVLVLFIFATLISVIMVTLRKRKLGMGMEEMRFIH